LQMPGNGSDGFLQLGRLNIDLLQANKRLQLNIHAWSGVYSIFASDAFQATAPRLAFPQEKPHVAEPDRA
jgi:hypothetical protein